MADSAAPARRPALSVSHLTALDAAPEDFVRHAAQAGFEAVGLRINPPPHTPAHWPVAADPRRTAALRRQIDDLGLSVLETEGFGLREDFSLDAVLPGLEASAVLGARFVLSGGVHGSLDWQIERYGRLAEAAAGFGLAVGAEFITWNALRTLAQARQVQAAVGASNLGILVDTLHLARTGGTAGDLLATPPQAFAYVQLCDAGAAVPAGLDVIAEARGHRLLPGEGELPLAGYLAALPGGIPITVEAPPAGRAHLPAAERIAAAYRATRDFLEHAPTGAARTSAS